MPRLNQDRHNQAFGMLISVQMVAALSRAFGCTKRTKAKLADCLRHTGSIRDQNCSGKPHVTMAHVDHYNTLMHQYHHHLLATVITRHYRITAQTIHSLRRANNRPICDYVQILTRTLCCKGELVPKSFAVYTC